MKKFRLPLLTLTVFLGCSLNSAASLLAEPEAIPELKPDTAKVDTFIKKMPPLKGSVEHSEQLLPKTKAAPTQNNGFAGKATLDNGAFQRGKVKQSKPDLLNVEAQSGIGIIGVKFVMILGRPPVINKVFPGTPAAEQGLRTNDIIVAVDGIPTYGLSKDEVYNMIVGTPRTPVTISVRRRGDFQVRTMQRMDFNEITDPRVRRDYQSM